MASVRKCQVLGIRNVEYTRQSSGELVQGKEFYFGFEREGVEGFATGSVFVYQRDLPRTEIMVDSYIAVFHDDYNRVRPFVFVGVDG